MTKKSDAKIYNLKAPAKINVGLRVLSKRKDGFHNLETIFYPIEIHDNIKLKKILFYRKSLDIFLS